MRLAELPRARLLYALVEGEGALCLGAFRRDEAAQGELSPEETVLRDYARALADQRALAELEGPLPQALGLLCRPVLRSDLEEARADGQDGRPGLSAAAGR